LDSGADDKLFGSLTPREREILQLLAEHLSDHEIAERLVVANTTVRWFNRQIFNKLNVSNRKEAVTRARQLGLLESSPVYLAPVKMRLPYDTTVFINRRIETTRIVELLSSPACNLLTLIGTGGIGKTRLALHAARKLAEQQFDSAVFVPLVGVSAAKFLPATLANALSFTFHMGEDEETQLLHYLSNKRLLLVIDNYEHLLPDVSLLVKIVQQSSESKLLVTSRERLNVREEWLLEVNGLSFVPEKAQTEAPPHAMQLFIQRAMQINPQFRSEGEDREALLNICRQLEGTPLALELAAGWARSLTAREIAESLREPFRLLTTRLHNVPERHRSLESVFEQTWTRLATQEQGVLRSLSVFRGGFTREAAEAVAGADFEVLASLKDKSLLARQETGRYELHELIRQYAEAKLKRDLDLEAAAHKRHGQYYAQLLHNHTYALINQHPLGMVALLTSDIENIRHAWGWLVANNDWSAFEQAWEAAWLFFNYTNRFQEGKAFFSAALSQSLAVFETSEHHIRVIALSGTAWFSFMLGQVVESKGMVDKAVVLAEQISLHDPHVLTWLLHTQISVLWALGDGEHALHQSHRALETANKIGGEYYTAMAHFNLGLSYYRLSKYEVAHEHLSQTITICNAIGYTMGTGYASAELGRTLEAMRNHHEARTVFEQSRSAFAQFEGTWGMANTLICLGRVTHRAGDSAEGARYLYEALDITLGGHLLHLTAAALTEFAPLLASAGQPLLARSVLQVLQEQPMGWPETQQRVERYLRELPLSTAADDLATESQKFAHLEAVIEVIQSRRAALTGAVT
jgi:predicted ATPase/DNA-binding CsgD family transcriptional regulator